ncbi:MAG TPA: 50S ribosomal protein L9 [Actinomycetota bacterium]|nr:50S ribosomal protein L9 [Actinomycetota bacterium]
MKIILQKEVEKLGVPGDVVHVADGYARNYLIPRKLAVPATRGGVRHAESLKQAHQARTQKALQEAQETADKLRSTTVRIRGKAGEDGRLFGSVTAAKAADEISKAAGVEVDRRHLDLSEPIRSVGTHEVVVHLHPEVDAAITVEVVRE